MLLKLAFLCFVSAVVAQDYDDYPQAPPRPAPTRIPTGNNEQKPTPVPILKQINRHNEDGSYTYGYEGADGSFKIETKLATGEVKGKYGYVDQSGKVRVVEYGANKYGFQPAGEGITVAPPTLVDETTNKDGLQINDYEDEQIQQQQQPKYRPQPQPQPKLHRPPPPQPQPQQSQHNFNQYQTEEEEQQSEPQPNRFNSPAPQRPQFANAAPIDVVYSQRPRPPRPEYAQNQQFIPSPQQLREQSQFVGRAHQAPQPSFRPQPQPIAYSSPRAAPVPRPQQLQQQQQQQPQQVHRPPSSQYQQAGRQGGSVLDQLAKDFALPENSSPALHDITYSYY